MRGWKPIHVAVRRIPRGRVATYGQVAALAGMPGRAREVGWALASLDDGDAVPWQRVVNARGEISARGEPAAAALQRRLLEREGVRFDLRGRIDLERYGFRSGAARRRKRGSQRGTSRQ